MYRDQSMPSVAGVAAQLCVDQRLSLADKPLRLRRKGSSIDAADGSGCNDVSGNLGVLKNHKHAGFIICVLRRQK